MRQEMETHGQTVELYSSDGGCTWSSSRQSIVVYGQRKTKVSLDLQKRIERIDGMQEPDPNNVAELMIRTSLIGR